MSGCEPYEVLANLALDEEATLEEIAELNRHLETCPDCRAYYADLKRIHEACTPGKIVLPAGFSDRVMARVRGTAQDPPEKPEKKTIPFPRWRQWAALAACCAVVVLSVWAVGSAVGVKGAGTTAGGPPQASQDMRSSAQGAADQDGPAPLLEENGTAAAEADEAVSVEAAPVLPEEYQDLAKAAAKDGLGEGQYQPLESGPSELETSPSAGPEYSFNIEDTDLLPDSGGAAPDRDSADTGDSQPAVADVPETPEGTGGTADRENLDDTGDMEDAVEPVPEPVLPAPEEVVEPVEIVNVPEPGILIAYSGGAAQSWVESVLGLEWAAGGSYPLSAEQYGALLDLLDQAGEPYQVEPGEGYCLMTE